MNGVVLRPGSPGLDPRTAARSLAELSRREADTGVPVGMRFGLTALVGEDPAVVGLEDHDECRLDLGQADDLGAGARRDLLGGRRRVDPGQRGLDQLAFTRFAPEGGLEVALPGHVPVGLHVADDLARRHRSARR